MRKFDPKVLPYIAAIAQAIQIGHAGFLLMGITGVLVGGSIGSVVSLNVAYASSQIASITGQKREKWANPAMVGVLLISPLLVAAAAFYSFDTIEIVSIRWITAISWALAPDGAIFLSGLIAGKKLVKQDESETKPPPKPKKPAFTCACGRSFKTQAALNGHQSAHNKNPRA